MTFVEPGMLTAVPAVITTRVARLDQARLRCAASIERFHRSSTSLHSGIQIGVTPHSIAIWCTDHCLCVSATIGRRGRSRATADAVRPVNVGTRIAFAPERLGEVARRVRHRVADRRILGAPRESDGGNRALGSIGARDAVHRLHRLTGYSPIAVSPESMTADVPSRIAFATSLASARVGSG